MAPSKNAEREAREARDRLRRYNARQTVHARQVRRRRRDNVFAVAGIIIIAALATVTQVAYFSTGPGRAAAKPTPSATASPSASSTPAAGSNVGKVPASTIAEGRTWTGELELNSVKLGIELFGDRAPQATSVFISLARDGFYTTKGSACHRLTTSETAKLIQCGSANGDGTGDVGFSFGPLENVPADGVYPAGTIAMARSTDPYSQSSQFFITYGTTTLDASTGGYTVFGRVTTGLDSLISEIAQKGVAANSSATSNPSDGAPVVATRITAVTVK
ncbi:peptidylprolyl isomerase [Parafrigoribacterium soli]|uniref:peptidylprolyl isomerase n=1 Tax=Parafrigoribacterium soli TaxID=3144663 RepID=UPI0032EF01E3